jgi:hypothetical protein
VVAVLAVDSLVLLVVGQAVEVVGIKRLALRVLPVRETREATLLTVDLLLAAVVARALLAVTLQPVSAALE